MELEQLLQKVLNSRTPGLWSGIPVWAGSAGPVGLVHWRQTRGHEQPQPRTHMHYFVHRHQVELGLAWGFDLLEDEEKRTPEWAGNLPNKRANPVYADILWNGAPVFRTLLWVVDGGRGYVPDPTRVFAEREPHERPKTERWEVSSRLVDFADVLNTLSQNPDDYSCADYCHQAGIVIVDQSRLW